jgi:hypothetical protein
MIQRASQFAKRPSIIVLSLLSPVTVGNELRVEVLSGLSVDVLRISDSLGNTFYKNGHVWRALISKSGIEHISVTIGSPGDVLVKAEEWPSERDFERENIHEIIGYDS